MRYATFEAYTGNIASTLYRTLTSNSLVARSNTEAKILGFHIVIDAVFGAFAALPRLLDTAEGSYFRRDQACIDAHYAVF